MLKYIGIVCFASMFMVSCKKEQPQMTPLNQECDCAKEVSAEFDILEPLGQGSNAVLIKTDNVLAGKSIYFRAQEDNAEYKWYIGSDIEATQNIDRYFFSSYAGTTIPVTLVVKKKPNLICFPNDDGYDSITKNFTLFARSDTSIMEGTFRIADKNSIDSIDIKFNLRGDYSNNIYIPNSGIGLDAYNFGGNGNYFENFNNYTVNRAYRAMKTDHYGGFPDLTYHFYIKHCELDLNGVFYIKYYYSEELDSDLILVERWGRKL